jgi:DNA primase
MVNFFLLEQIGGWLTFFPPEKHEELELLHDAFIEEVHAATIQYYRVEQPATRLKLHEWKETLGEYPKECRLRYLNEKRSRMRQEENAIRLAAFSGPVSDEDLKKAQNLAKAILGLSNTIQVLEGKRDGITEDMVSRAKEFPMDQIVDLSPQGFALCVAHNDRSPSMYCKENFAYCFSCGFTDDTIGVYMKKNDANFAEAVASLQ